MNIRQIEEKFYPTNDYVFKRIFGYKGNEEITKAFLNTILSTPVKSVSLETNPITLKDLKDDKVCVLDIKAILDAEEDKKYVNIEMQICDRKNTEKRIMYYWAKNYASQIHIGEDYNKLRKTIEIFILDYKLNEEDKEFFNEYGILKKHAKGLEIELTNDLELYIIELPKLEDKLSRGEKVDNRKLISWLKFIINPNEVEETDMEENKELMWASNELEYISEDEHERFLAEQRAEFQRLEIDLKIAGREEVKKEIAKKMLEENFELETIIKLTGLTKEEINSLI